jgi:hypothetical protein
MAPSTGDFDEYAADLARRFAQLAREDYREREAVVRLRDEDMRLPLQDVHLASEALREQCQFLRVSKLKFPCVVPRDERDQTPVPLSLGFEHNTVISMAWAVTAGPLELLLPLVMRFQDRGMEEFATGGIWGRSARFVQVEIGEAITFFQRRLTAFLGTRLQASLSAPPPSPGLKFTVETDTDRLRVSYAPIFWKSNQRTMNQLSRVATDYLDSGQYYFGAAPPGQNPQFDYSASYVLPNDSYAKLAM